MLKLYSRYYCLPRVSLQAVNLSSTSKANGTGFPARSINRIDNSLLEDRGLPPHPHFIILRDFGAINLVFHKIPSTYARPFVNSEIPPYVSFVNEKLQQTREGRKEPAWKKKKEQRHPHRDKWSLRKWMGGWLENVVYWFSVERSGQCVPGKGESCTHSNMRTTFVDLLIRCATSTCLFHLIWPTAPLHMFFIMFLASFLPSFLYLSPLQSYLAKILSSMNRL